MMKNERDFTNCRQNKFKSYLGANGSKKCLIIDGEEYMVKFSPVPTKATELSYTNSCVSEYLGCHIFELAGIPVQKTMLGTYTTESGKTKIVVACKDVTSPGVELIPFAGLKNQIVDSPQNGYGTELSEILETFEKQDSFSPKELTERFWDMFIVDALIGNWDRHNGNWGYLYNSLSNTVELAPVYDCGSSLFPQADERMIKEILSNKNELNYRVYSVPLSSIKINDKKINYRDFINALENEDCNKALKRIYSNLSMDKIRGIIKETPYITDVQKEFFTKILEARHDLILTPAYNKLIKREREQKQKIDTVNIISIEDLGVKYIDKVLEYSRLMAIKDAACKTYDELINSGCEDKIIRQKMLNEYLKSKGIESNKDFSDYITKLKTESVKKDRVQKRNSNFRDENIGRS